MASAFGEGLDLIDQSDNFPAASRRREYSDRMYSVGIRDHIMVAHSLRGEVFGPAQGLHGATYSVSAELEHEELDAHGIVIDIGLFRDKLREVLRDLDYRNLDEHPAFQDRPSTSEIIARHIHRELGRRLPVLSGTLLVISLEESPVAWVRYRAPARGAAAAPAPRKSRPGRRGAPEPGSGAAGG